MLPVSEFLSLPDPLGLHPELFGIRLIVNELNKPEPGVISKQIIFFFLRPLLFYFPKKGF